MGQPVAPSVANQSHERPKDKGRFEPVNVAKWINEKTILSTPYPAAPDDTGAATELGDK